MPIRRVLERWSWSLAQGSGKCISCLIFLLQFVQLNLLKNIKVSLISMEFILADLDRIVMCDMGYLLKDHFFCWQMFANRINKKSFCLLNEQLLLIFFNNIRLTNIRKKYSKYSPISRTRYWSLMCSKKLLNKQFVKKNILHPSFKVKLWSFSVFCHNIKSCLLSLTTITK